MPSSTILCAFMPRIGRPFIVDLGAGIGPDRTGDRLEQTRLAGTVGAENHADLALVDLG